MKSVFALVVLLLVSISSVGADRSDEVIPGDLLDKCECIAIVPGLKKGGLGLGGKYGKGIVMCRKPNKTWTAPSFLTIEGGSIGLQIGFTQIDVVMLIMNRKGVDRLI